MKYNDANLHKIFELNNNSDKKVKSPLSFSLCW